MKTAGIIAEYNPFHSGHAYQIAQTRALGYTHICVVMSENTVQRGDIAILDAHARAKAAISGGADLVIGLMPPYSIGSARDFASAGVSILKRLGAIDALSFGAELRDAERLCQCAQAIENVDKNELKKLMSGGFTYPQAMSRAIGGFEDILSQPNCTLALEYIRAMRGSGMTPIAIKRTAVHDSDVPSGGYASASYLRSKMILGEDVSRYINYDYDREDISCMERISNIVLWKIISALPEEIMQAPCTGGGIGQRIIKSAMTAESLSALYEAAKTRNVTHARVRRAVLAIALGITAQDMQSPPYARVLAANSRGFEILAQCKPYASLPVSASLADLSKTGSHALRCAELTEKASRLRFMARAVPGAKYKSEMEREAFYDKS